MSLGHPGRSLQMAPVLGEIEAGEPDGAPTAGNLQPQLPGKCVPEAPQLLVTTKLLAPGHHCPPLTLAGTKEEGPSTPPDAPVIQAPGSVLKQDPASIPASRGRSRWGILLKPLQRQASRSGGEAEETKGRVVSFCHNASPPPPNRMGRAGAPWSWALVPGRAEAK